MLFERPVILRKYARISATKETKIDLVFAPKAQCYQSPGATPRKVEHTNAPALKGAIHVEHEFGSRAD
jgi:hypothetical protein